MKLAFQDMLEQERCELPTAVYGNAFNYTRDMIEEHFPELRRYLPPRLETGENIGCQQVTFCRFGEIHS